MNEPPIMLSSKDLMYISDILSITYTFIKKFDHYDNEISDDELKDIVRKISGSLRNQYYTLLEVLNG